MFHQQAVISNLVDLQPKKRNGIHLVSLQLSCYAVDVSTISHVSTLKHPSWLMAKLHPRGFTKDKNLSSSSEHSPRMSKPSISRTPHFFDNVYLHVETVDPLWFFFFLFCWENCKWRCSMLQIKMENIKVVSGEEKQVLLMGKQKPTKK